MTSQSISQLVSHNNFLLSFKILPGQTIDSCVLQLLLINLFQRSAQKTTYGCKKRLKFSGGWNFRAVLLRVPVDTGRLCLQEEGGYCTAAADCTENLGTLPSGFQATCDTVNRRCMYDWVSAFFPVTGI